MILGSSIILGSLSGAEVSGFGVYRGRAFRVRVGGFCLKIRRISRDGSGVLPTRGWASVIGLEPSAFKDSSGFGYLR